MCGIFGSTGVFAENSMTTDLVMNLLELRGPDDSGVVNLGNITLGHTRLAIQDAEFGIQPMKSNSGVSTIVFNGEIYNHFELRELLPNLKWRTDSDTETVVELIEAFGPEVTNKFIGMFAFGIWNNEKFELILVRDRFGEKPLYYSLQDGELVFCSDPRGISMLFQRSNQLAVNQMPYFLKYGYVNSEESTFSTVKMLEPGQILNWKKKEFTASLIQSNKAKKSSKKFELFELRSKIEIAVERTLLADEAVGVMLSGGLDSSIIAALAAKSCEQIPTYTVSLTENSEDAKFAKSLAKQLKSNHHEIQINAESLAENIEDILSNVPQPFADSAIIPTFILSKLASRDVKVLLSGDGADEIFAGYGYYEKYKKIGCETTPKYVSFLKQFRYELSKNSRSKRVNRNREEFRESLLTSGRLSPQESWSQDLAAFTDSELSRIFDLHCGQIHKGTLGISGQNADFWDVLYSDRKSYLAGDILRKSDMGGMLASIEIRSPYLDKDLVEYLSESIIEPNNLSKGILYKSCEDLIPKEIIQRKKQGFGAPLNLWLSYPAVEKLVSGILMNPKSKIYKYFDYENVSNVVNKSNLKKWNFFSLALWLEKNA
jgi:asparagine synthase (glutamine-hydrolysing)